jgi:hypothetical protein
MIDNPRPMICPTCGGPAVAETDESTFATIEWCYVANNIIDPEFGHN